MFEFNGPRYRAVMNVIKEHIQSGRYPADHRLQTVRDLAASYSISHATAARVYQELTREGWVYVKGNATLVRDRGQAKITIRVPVVRAASDLGGGVTQLPGWGEVTEAGIVVPPDYVCDVMQLPRGTEVLRRETVESWLPLDARGGYGDDREPKPFTLTVYWHPAEFAELLPAMLTTGRDTSTSPLVYLGVGGRIVEQMQGRSPRGGVDSLHARHADEREADRLGIAEGDTVLARVTTREDEQGVSEYAEMVYPKGVVISHEYHDPFDTDPADA